jgi:hypothetical protein
MTDAWQGTDDDLEFDDELDDEWLAESDEAERQAVELLRTALAEHRGRPAPASELAEAAAAVRARVREGGGVLEWVWQAAGLRKDPAPEADDELLVRLAAATISPQEETGLDIEEESLLISLEMADWLGSIVTAVRSGPGSDASPRALMDGVRNCPEVELESDLDIDDESHLDAAFSIVALPWHVLGLTDRDDFLTELGVWVLPRALARAWGGDFDEVAA